MYYIIGLILGTQDRTEIRRAFAGGLAVLIFVWFVLTMTFA